MSWRNPATKAYGWYEANNQTHMGAMLASDVRFSHHSSRFSDDWTKLATAANHLAASANSTNFIRTKAEI